MSEALTEFEVIPPPAYSYAIVCKQRGWLFTLYRDGRRVDQRSLTYGSSQSCENAAASALVDLKAGDLR